MKKIILSNNHDSILNKIVGESPDFLSLKNQIRKIASTNLPVLIQGESGAGKTHIAQTIHELSERPGLFISINLSSIPSSMAIAELFGYQKGAFNSSTSNNAGKIEKANGGTLYLDELESTSFEVQRLLVRFLNTYSIIPVGGSAELKVDVRIIASVDNIEKRTNLSGDLINRLSGFFIQIPPLRAHNQDIPLLINLFMRQSGSKLKFSKDALKLLMEYSFPGNIRELFNIIRRSVMLAQSERKIIKPNDLMLEENDYRRAKDVEDKDAQNIVNLKRALDNLKQTSIIAKPIWEGRTFTTQVDYCFLLMPFDDSDDIQKVYLDHLKPLIEHRCGLRCERADDIHDINGVMQSVWESINKSRIIIAEMTGRNPNVFYELGIAHTLGKPVIMITQSMDFIPSDLKHLRCIVYSYKPTAINKFEDSLEKTVKQVLSSEFKWG